MRKKTSDLTAEEYAKHRAYMKNYQKQWLKRRRTQWIEENGPCKICGSSSNLEIDHINPAEKEIKISSLWSYKKEIRDKELAKCQVLCKSCHFKKTNKEAKAFGHGTSIKYATCNCVICNQMKKFNNSRKC